MIFYGTFTKVGKAIQEGWINDNYPAKTPVKPRVYHKYIKDDDRANLYPEEKEPEETPAEETPTEEPVVAKTPAPETKVDDDDDPQAPLE